MIVGGIRNDLKLGIEMDVDGSTDGKEEDPHGRTSAVGRKVVVVENAVVDTLTGSAILVDCLVKLRFPRNGWIKTDVICVLNVDGASIAGGRAVTAAGTGIQVFVCSSQWASELKTVVFEVFALIDHAAASVTDRRTISVICNIVLDNLLFQTAYIEVNKRINMPNIVKEAVSGHVVMSGVETDVFNTGIRTGCKELVKTDKTGSRVMTPGRKYTDMHGEVYMSCSIM